MEVNKQAEKTPRSPRGENHTSPPSSKTPMERGFVNIEEMK